jgi:transcriptional regulator with PAS, ATPase and Fis domain
METQANKSEFIAVDESSRQLLAMLKRYAPFSDSVLLQGDTGVGKEVAAQTVHQFSRRADQPFIAVNCAAIPETLIESELFGHERGSFTGATQTKLGHFELAHNGTLFLDEIGELSAAAQAKLLRVIETSEIRRVGGEQTRRVNVRLISATHRDLVNEPERFRADLYFRVAVLPARLIPLSQRPGDLVMLCDGFLQRSAHETGPRVLLAAALQKLLSYHWPGNVRELRNVIKRAAIISPGVEIGPESIKFDTVSGVCQTARPRQTTLRLVSDETFIAELERSNWNRRQTARNLGIVLSTVKAKINKLGLKDPSRG